MAARIFAVASAALMLTACLLSPGTFTADMTVLRNGGFSFAYKGEIQLQGLSQLMAMGAALDDDGALFVPDPCYGEPDALDAAVLKTAWLQDEDAWVEEAVERECTAAEIERQQSQWEDRRAAKKAEDARMMEMIKGLLGGIDPGSPDAVDEFVVRIKKQKGWREVEHKGDGLFMVDYAASGRIDQDYTFPVIEKTQGLAPFVVASARANGAVRIDAPAFVGLADSGVMGGGLGGLWPMLQAIGAASGSKEAKMFAALPTPKGRFIIRTDGDILTNNTDDGPVAAGGMKVLQWTVNARSKKAPEALIMLDPV
ncbi:MAG: hypothetical protein MEP44_02020 [Blastomonas sp.]|nr:hypothetical protein [Blastomonas sp.]